MPGGAPADHTTIRKQATNSGREQRMDFNMMSFRRSDPPSRIDEDEVIVISDSESDDFTARTANAENRPGEMPQRLGGPRLGVLSDSSNSSSSNSKAGMSAAKFVTSTAGPDPMDLDAVPYEKYFGRSGMYSIIVVDPWQTMHTEPIRHSTPEALEI